MNILLLGKQGQVGFELQRALAPLGSLVAVDRARCDVSNPDQIHALVDATKPDLIVNATAYTAVDQAQTKIDTAYAINAQAPSVLATLAAQYGALLVHYSTDYVFDGTKRAPYLETDTPHPINVYGQSKLAGERAIANSGARYLIFRCSWVFSARGHNFVNTILRLATHRTTLEVVSDQLGTPTSAALIADVSAHIIARALFQGALSFPYGLYHLSASGYTDWCTYAKTIVHAAQHMGYPLTLHPDEIHPITTQQYGATAPRPANSRLNTDALQHTFGLTLPSWQTGLEPVLAEHFGIEKNHA